MMLLRVTAFTFFIGTMALAFPHLAPPRDFVEYYSAAKVLAEGGDPYDGAQLLPVQREVTGNAELEMAVSLWTPPWTLPVYLPFGFLPFVTAHLFWLLVQAALLALSVELLWTQCGGPRRLGLLIPYALLLGFAPVFWNLHFGQSTAFLLFGLAGFLHFRTRGSPALAGACATLTAIKPHMLALFGIALLMDAATRTGRRTLAVGIGILVIANGVSLVCNPHIFGQFIAAVRRPSTPETVRLADWHVPLLGYEFRHAIAPESFALQFLPVLVAGLLTAAWQWKRPPAWPLQLPWLVVASALVAPYGGWMFDLTILLLPALAALIRIAAPRQPLPVLASVSALGLLSLFGFLIRGLEEPIWFAPLFALWFAGTMRWSAALRGSPL
jgi:hypothetical protein